MIDDTMATRGRSSLSVQTRRRLQVERRYRAKTALERGRGGLTAIAWPGQLPATLSRACHPDSPCGAGLGASPRPPPRAAAWTESVPSTGPGAQPAPRTWSWDCPDLEESGDHQIKPLRSKWGRVPGHRPPSLTSARPSPSGVSGTQLLRFGAAGMCPRPLRSVLEAPSPPAGPTRGVGGRARRRA